MKPTSSCLENCSKRRWFYRLLELRAVQEIDFELFIGVLLKVYLNITNMLLLAIGYAEKTKEHACPQSPVVSIFNSAYLLKKAYLVAYLVLIGF